MQNEGLIGIFLTGIFAGGLSCIVVQGGLLAASVAQREEEHIKKNLHAGSMLPTLSFLSAKLLAYTLLGFLLGWLGSVIQISITTAAIMQAAAGIFMLGTALNILNIHPVFRYFVIKPPRFVLHFVKKQEESRDIFAPAVLGALTVLIPCGATQAIMALAIASGNPLYGAAVLFAFVLGTSPVFFLLGYFAAKLGVLLRQRFLQLASVSVIFFAIININNAISLTGSSITLDSLGKHMWCTLSYCDHIPDPVSNAEIAIASSGYFPNLLTVRRGSMVTLTLKNANGRNCTQAFTIPGLKIQKVVPLGGSETITFRAPDTPGQVPFMCSTGSYRGVIHVI